MLESITGVCAKILRSKHIMPERSLVPTIDLPMCPHCQRTLTLVASWTFRGLWGYNEVRTYECPEHGPIFVSPQAAVEYVPDKRLDKGSDDGDRDSLVPAPRKPAPTLNADAIAIPEPD
jgi:hypothetical protein